MDMKDRSLGISQGFKVAGWGVSVKLKFAHVMGHDSLLDVGTVWFGGMEEIGSTDAYNSPRAVPATILFSEGKPDNEK
jgi:hypothetical protein